MSNFLTLHYWFNAKPGSLEGVAQKGFYIFLLLLLMGCVATHILKKKKAGLFLKIWDSLFNFSLTNLIIGLCLQFFTYELVPFLSSRILFLVWGISMLVWLGFTVRKFLEIPKIKQEKAKVNEFKKYIP